MYTHVYSMYMCNCIYYNIVQYYIIYHNNTLSARAWRHTGDCRRSTPAEERTLGNISLKNTKSEGGEQSLLLDCMAKDRKRALVVSQTLVFMISRGGFTELC